MGSRKKAASPFLWLDPRGKVKTQLLERTDPKSLDDLPFPFFNKNTNELVFLFHLRDVIF
ncbi:hypothetical protein EEL32_07595 [Brevibacillus laterosporus]|uniref:Uncharacterized protein n=1 Tax=Brevibacillus laterosporus TaxID=1465 RepID=A0A502H0Q3_BRELA|nr:hypothetical protein EEL30_19320 [Brevibacillus laterosporus]TPG68179.1 hypothetical protein EEL31_06290 [Brevibacillus laterosporus]TPG88805.1 hypothetical protein EEL32_07595 [Brevibacillus laterosporus]